MIDLSFTKALINSPFFRYTTKPGEAVPTSAGPLNGKVIYINEYFYSAHKGTVFTRKMECYPWFLF